jgi:hypothetical protein
MAFSTLVWHLSGFLLPAVALGVIAASLAGLLWRRAARSVGWARLAGVSVLACLLAALGTLVVTGRDGTMAGYAAMIVACALAQAWLLRRA